MEMEVMVSKLRRGDRTQIAGQWFTVQRVSPNGIWLHVKFMENYECDMSEGYIPVDRPRDTLTQYMDALHIK